MVIMLFLVFDWMIVNIPLISNLINSGKFTEEQIFLEINGMNFEGSNKLSVIYIIPFVLILYFFFKGDNTVNIVRFPSRTYFVKNKLVDIVTIALLFSIIHEVINVAANYLNFSLGTMIKYDFFLYSLINILVIVLYYFRVGLVFFVFQTLTRKFAVIFTILLYCIEYFVLGQYFFYYSWLPNKDSVVLSGLMIGVLSGFDVGLICIRGLGMNLLLSMLGISIYKRKDILVK